MSCLSLWFPARNIRNPTGVSRSNAAVSSVVIAPASVLRSRWAPQGGRCPGSSASTPTPVAAGRLGWCAGCWRGRAQPWPRQRQLPGDPADTTGRLMRREFLETGTSAVPPSTDMVADTLRGWPCCWCPRRAGWNRPGHAPVIATAADGSGWGMISRRPSGCSASPRRAERRITGCWRRGRPIRAAA
jgi:hypothetical protein